MPLLKSIFRAFSNLLKRKNVFITKSLSYRAKEQVLPPNFDYIRYATLGLCYEQIIERSVEGNIAELGVFKGDFAMRMNSLFNTRLLYLFDTYEGFDSKDKDIEFRKGFDIPTQDFSNTSISYVRSRMPYPDKCIFKKGYFPDSALDVDDKFCFVSIDADLYEPIYAGLNYFYPRLIKGGYIFVHDFENDYYKGAKEAVLNFCKEHSISFVPLPDNGGSVILTK